MSVPVGIHPLVNNIDQISSDNYQMSLAREGYVQRGVWSVQRRVDMPPEQIDRQTPVKTLPSRNYCCGR